MKRVWIGAMAVLVIASTSMAVFQWTDVGPGMSRGISWDGQVIAYDDYSAATIPNTNIWSAANGSKQVFSGAGMIGGSSVGIAQLGSDYVVAANWQPTGSYYRSQVWKGDAATGVGTITSDPFSTGTGNYFWSRGIGGHEASTGTTYVAGHEQTSISFAARWKAPAGSVTGYNQPSNFTNTLYTLYAASHNGRYGGQGRLSSAGTASNKAQPMVLDGSLISLQTPYGAPSTSYYGTVQGMAGTGVTAVGYSGLADNTTAQACYWDRGAAFTTSTVANWIPFLSGYTKSYAMRADDDASVIAGYMSKPGYGANWRTIFLYDKATNTVSDLRAVLTSAGVDLTNWGLMDVTGISGDGLTLTGTMLPASNAYWTTGAAPAASAYETFVVTLPEPATLAFLGLGGLVLVRRRVR